MHNAEDDFDHFISQMDDLTQRDVRELKQSLYKTLLFRANRGSKFQSAIS